MNHTIKQLGFFSFCFCAVLQVLCARSHAELLHAILPAYEDPESADGSAMWSAWTASASNPARNFLMYAILNPSSGPGNPVSDTRFVNSSGGGVLPAFVGAGGNALGYVKTQNGTRPLNDVKADILAYTTSKYGPYVSGIFFDEMSNDVGSLAYYSDLQSFVKGLNNSYKTMGNPGTPFLNPFGQPSSVYQDFRNVLDSIMSIETNANDYINAYNDLPYNQGFPADKFAHIVYDNAAWNPSILETASSRGAGYVYITDDVFPDDPYDKLPTYWNTFAADLIAFNTAAVPEPTSFVMVSLGIFVSFRRRQRLRANKTMQRSGDTDGSA